MLHPGFLIIMHIGKNESSVTGEWVRNRSSTVKTGGASVVALALTSKHKGRCVGMSGAACPLGNITWPCDSLAAVTV